MNSQVMNIFWYLSTSSLMAGLPALLIYASARWLEKQWAGWAYLAGFVALAMIWIPASFIFDVGRSLYPAATVTIVKCVLGFFIVGPAVGGVLHRRSGGASKQGWSAFLLMESVVLGNLFGAAFVSFITERAGFPLYQAVARIHLPGIVWVFVYPVLMPLGFWIGRSMKLRPGIDVLLARSEVAK